METQHGATIPQRSVTTMELLLPDAQRIRELRETRKHYSQAGLAESAGCSEGTILRVEKGLATNQGTLERIARALGVGLAEITCATSLTKRLLSNSQLVAILDCIRPSEEQPVASVKRRESVARIDDRGQGVLALLISLGLIKIEGQEPQSVSELSDAFLASLRAHFRDGGRHYFGQWSTGATSPAGRKLASLIRSCEEHRIETLPLPARQVRAALGIIRADHCSQPRFLMLKEPTWNSEGAWWFIGGLEKARDGGDLARTMLREMREELAFEDGSAIKVQCLGQATDGRFSGRLGVFTRYEYHVFQVEGQDCPAMRRLLLPRPAVEIYAPGNPSFMRVHAFQWFSWKELLAMDHLAKHAQPVVDLLRKIDPLRLPSIGKLEQEVEGIGRRKLRPARIHR